MDELSTIYAEIAAGLTFYRQERIDGGIRTGIMAGMTTVFERFEINGDEYDPSLIWSVDLRCQGASLPMTANDAKEWLLALEAEICDGFQRFADQLGAGSDPTGVDLLQWSDFRDLPPDISMKIVCGPLRRIDALYLASRLKYVGENWVTLVSSLESSLHEAY